MRRIFLLTFTLLTFTGILSAQAGRYFANTEGALLTPIGSLSDRFTGTYSGAVSFGIQTSENWTWYGKLEYFKYDKLNKEKMFMTRQVLVGVTNVNFRIPLAGMQMDLTVAGLSANAKYNLIRTSLLETNIDLGFGVYRWLNHRGGLDSVSVDTSSVKGEIKYFNLLRNIPASHQLDWSGGFNIGAEFVINLLEPLSITLSGNYKNVLGELWPALALDIENTSSFQMLEYQAGFRIEF